MIIDDKELDGTVSFELTLAGQEHLPGVKNSEYPYWFDIVTPMNAAVVYAQYELAVADYAQQVLAQHGIPLTFPAVTADERSNVYYLSGDFADYTKDNLMKWQGSEHLMKLFQTSNLILCGRPIFRYCKILLHQIGKRKGDWHDRCRGSL